MSGKKDQQSTNLLFSPDLFGSGNTSTSAFLMPVQDSSALMTSETMAEEDSFIGQNEPNQPAVFSMFSGPSTNDAFASVGDVGNVVSKTTGVVTSVQQPSLFVPSSNESMGTPPTFPGSGYNTASFNTPGIQATSTPATAIHNPALPPPPTQGYMSTPTGRTSSPYMNRRYVAPDYGTPAASTAPPLPVSSHVPPPPSMTQTHTPASYIAPPQPPQSQYPPSSAPPASFTKLAGSVPPPPLLAQNMYHPVSAHWCHCKALSDGTVLWYPFSYYDSQRLEEASNNDLTQIISTEGGRYDVSVAEREKTSVYWEEPVALVRRCTWFAKGDSDHKYEPFEEVIAEMLEEEYQKVVMNNNWHKQIDLDGGQMIVIHNPQVIVHLVPRENKDQFGGIPELQMYSRIVKRGITEIDLGTEIPESEIGAPDHVVFVCHGIGPVCDLRSRTIVECVDDFRAIQLSLLKSHFKNALESKHAQRIEFLPVHWHRALHGDANGVDRDIRRLTLPSIQRLRQFTNETLLDILFYSSPVYCQTIAETIGSEINSLHRLFLSRNPEYEGKFSVAGHSLGSLMLFDLLCNQGSKHQDTVDQPQKQAPAVEAPHALLPPDVTARSSTPTSTQDGSFIDDEVEVTLEDVLAKLNLTPFRSKFEEEQIEMESLLLCSESDLKDLGLPMGPRKKLVGYLKQQQKEKEKKQEQREAEIKRLEEERKLREQSLVDHTVTNNQQQMQQRMESISSFMASAMNVHVDFQQYDSGTGQPMVKYPQLQFEPSVFFALGSPIGMFLTVRGISELGEDFCLPTCGKFFNVFHPYDPVAYRVEPLINPDFISKPVQVPHYKGRKRLHLELRDSLGRMGTELKQGIINSVKKAMETMQRFAHNHWQTGPPAESEVEKEVQKVTDELLKEQNEKPHDNDDIVSVASETSQVSGGLGKLNGGHRIDYVLQERPLESFNDYLFAFQSHLCYWNSEDTVLLMMKEIYKGMDVLSDSQIKKIQIQQQATVPPPPMIQNYGPPSSMASHPPPLN